MTNLIILGPVSVAVLVTAVEQIALGGLAVGPVKKQGDTRQLLYTT